jgi:hypothetical protein
LQKSIACLGSSGNYQIKMEILADENLAAFSSYGMARFLEEKQ